MDIQKINKEANYFITPLKFIRNYWISDFDSILKKVNRFKIEKIRMIINKDKCIVIILAKAIKKLEVIGSISNKNILWWGEKFGCKFYTINGIPIMKSWWTSKRRDFKLEIYSILKHNSLIYITKILSNSLKRCSPLLYAISKVLLRRTIRFNITNKVKELYVIFRLEFINK